MIRQPPRPTLFPYTPLSRSATDIGFSMPAAAFGALRTAVINLTAEICGSRFGRGWIIPGGVRFDLDLDLVEKVRSEEHTSELQSQSNLVCRLLLEKKTL